MRGTLAEWWGADVQAWKLLKIYRIPYAQPAQRPPYTVNQAAKVRVTVLAWCARVPSLLSLSALTLPLSR